MNELEIKEYILNIINTKAEDIEGVWMCIKKEIMGRTFMES